MTDPKTFWLIVLTCAAISIALRLLPLKIRLEQAPSFFRTLIDRTGKYVSTTLLVCVLAGFLCKPALNPLANFSPLALALIALSFLAGLSRYKNHHLFLVLVSAYLACAALGLV